MPHIYDRGFLQEYADRLYRQADFGIFIWGVAGAFAGIIAGAAYGRAINRDDLVLIVALLGAVLGLAYGWRRAFWIKLEAQRTLCQMMIEQHLSELVALQKGSASAAKSGSYLS